VKLRLGLLAPESGYQSCTQSWLSLEIRDREVPPDTSRRPSLLCLLALPTQEAPSSTRPLIAQSSESRKQRHQDTGLREMDSDGDLGLVHLKITSE
jgi:hypothetical protein